MPKKKKAPSEEEETVESAPVEEASIEEPEVPVANPEIVVDEPDPPAPPLAAAPVLDHQGRKLRPGNRKR